MGWGTDFTAEIYLSRLTFKNKEEVLNLIKDTEDLLNDYKTKLLMFAAATPKDIIPNADDDTMFYLHNEVSSLINEIISESNLLLKLNLYLETLEKTPEAKE